MELYECIWKIMWSWEGVSGVGMVFGKKAVLGVLLEVVFGLILCDG